MDSSFGLDDYLVDTSTRTLAFEHDAMLLTLPPETAHVGGGAGMHRLKHHDGAAFRLQESRKHNAAPLVHSPLFLQPGHLGVGHALEPGVSASCPETVHPGASASVTQTHVAAMPSSFCTPPATEGVDALRLTHKHDHEEDPEDVFAGMMPNRRHSVSVDGRHHWDTAPFGVSPVVAYASQSWMMQEPADGAPAAVAGSGFYRETKVQEGSKQEGTRELQEEQERWRWQQSSSVEERRYTGEMHDVSNTGALIFGETGIPSRDGAETQSTHEVAQSEARMAQNEARMARSEAKVVQNEARMVHSLASRLPSSTTTAGHNQGALANESLSFAPDAREKFQLLAAHAAHAMAVGYGRRAEAEPLAADVAAFQQLFEDEEEHGAGGEEEGGGLSSEVDLGDMPPLASNFYGTGGGVQGGEEQAEARTTSSLREPMEGGHVSSRVAGRDVLSPAMSGGSSLSARLAAAVDRIAEEKKRSNLNAVLNSQPWQPSLEESSGAGGKAGAMRGEWRIGARESGLGAEGLGREDRRDMGRTHVEGGNSVGEKGSRREGWGEGSGRGGGGRRRREDAGYGARELKAMHSGAATASLYAGGISVAAAFMEGGEGLHGPVLACLLSLAEAYSILDKPRILLLRDKARQLVDSSGTPLQRLGSCVLDALMVRYEGLSMAQIASRLDFTEEQVLSALETCFSRLPHIAFVYTAILHSFLPLLLNKPVIHLVAFGFFNSREWLPFLRALASRPCGMKRVIRITVVSVEAGMWTAGFKGTAMVCADWLQREAESMGLTVEYDLLYVDRNRFHFGMVQVMEGEALVVCAVWSLCLLPDASVVRSDPRSSFLKGLQKLNPLLVAISEVDFDGSNPSFVPRLKAVARFYASLFHSADLVLPRSSSDRRLSEHLVFAADIVNMVAMEGTSRVTRPETAEKWSQRFVSAGFRSVALREEIRGMLARKVASYPGDFSVKYTEGNGIVKLQYEKVPTVFASLWKVE